MNVSNGIDQQETAFLQANPLLRHDGDALLAMNSVLAGLVGEVG